jgi:hypothetical protein
MPLVYIFLQNVLLLTCISYFAKKFKELFIAVYCTPVNCVCCFFPCTVQLLSSVHKSHNITGSNVYQDSSVLRTERVGTDSENFACDI